MKYPLASPARKRTAIKGFDARRSHHGNGGRAAEHRRKPQTCLPPQLGRHEAGRCGADEGAQSHERRDQLLARRLNVPANLWRIIAVNLRDV